MFEQKLNSVLVKDCIRINNSSVEKLKKEFSGTTEEVENFIDYSKNAKRRINCIYKKP